MRATLFSRSLAISAFAAALSLGGCSDSPTTSSQNPGENPGGPAISLLEPLSLNRQVLLVDTLDDLTATLKAEAPTGYTLDSVTLHSLDADDNSVAVLATLRDVGDAADGDMVAGDKIFAGVAPNLSYPDPQILRVAAHLQASGSTGGSLELWTEARELPVLSTDLVFTHGPDATPQGLTTGVSTDLRVVTELMVADSLTLDSVDLSRVTSTGDSVELLSPLRDNGDLTNGDEIQADGNYTTIVEGMFIVAPQTLYLRALATATSVTGTTHTSWSVIAELPVRYPPTEGLVNVALSYQDSIETRWQDAIDASEDLEATRDALLSWLDGQDHVVDAYLAPDRGSLWAVYNNGFEAGVLLADPADGPLYGTSGGAGIADAPVRPHRDPATTAPLMSVGVPARPVSGNDDRNLGDPDEVDSNLALVYSPFATWLEGLGGTDPASTVATLFDDAHCPSFGVDYLRDAEATVDALRDLYRYGAVSIFTHSAQLAGGELALLTGEEVDYERCLAHSWDLFDSHPSMCIVRTDGRSVFAVKAGFVAKYNHRFPNSIIQIAACDVSANNIWPLAFMESGVGYLTTFDGSVTVDFANEASLAFWSNLLENGDRSGAAYEASPQVDPGHRHAAFTATGNPMLFYGQELQNGGFELGTLAAWDVAGDGRVISRLDDQLPIDGNAMGIISTGLGYTLNTGEINQVVCVPATATQLSFHYNFFSEEFLEWCGSGYQDYFQVSVIDGVGTETVIFYIEVDNMCDSVYPANIQFDQGPLGDDNGVYYTGWRQLGLDLTPWAGQTVTLRFAAGDIGDSIFDSAILIDAISIE